MMRIDRLFSHRMRLHAAALVFFALLAFICLYPLLVHHRTHGAGYDYFFPHWTFWWTRHALTTDGLSVFESDFVMFPFSSNYAFNALTLFWFPTWAVLEPLVGTLTAMTAIIMVACALNGYLMFAWLLDERIAPGLALIGGTALQMFPILRYFYYNTHINLMNWFWLPVTLLVWKRIAMAVEGRNRRRALGWTLAFGLALWGVVLTGLQPPIFVAFVLGPYGLWTLWRARRRILLAAAGAGALALALVLLWLAGPLAHILSFDDPLVPSPVEERPVIPFPDGFFTMSDTWWDWATPSLGAFVTIVTLGSVMAAAWWRRNGETWFWLLVLIPPLVLAMGPTLRVGGAEIPLPFRLLYEVTGGNFRMPWRLAPAFVVAAMVFAGKVWSPALPRVAAGRVALLAAVFLLLAIDLRLYETGPLRPLLPGYEVYEAMGRERGAPYDDYVVLEVPTGAGTGEVLLGDPEAIAFQYYGITHGKRMVNGFISRAPIEYFWYLHLDDPMLSWLGQRRLLEADRVADQLRERVFGWPIGYVVVHQDFVRRNGAQPLEITGYLNAQTDVLCPPVVEGDAVFYRTAWHPDGCTPRVPPESAPGVYTIDVGASGDERYLGWGWHWQETVAGLTLRWAGDHPTADVFVDLPPGAYEVSMAMQAFDEPRQVQVSMNGVALGDPVTVGDGGLAAYTFALPEELVAAGEHLTLTLTYDGWLIPVEIGQSQDQRRLAVAVDWISFKRVAADAAGPA